MKPILALALMAGPAFAQQNCLPHDDMVTILAERYGEVLRAAGLDRNGKLMELYGAEGGTWSITVTVPGGITCIVGAGEMFGTTEAPVPGVAG